MYIYICIKCVCFYKKNINEKEMFVKENFYNLRQTEIAFKRNEKHSYNPTTLNVCYICTHKNIHMYT